MKSKKSLTNFWKDPGQLHNNKHHQNNNNNNNNSNQNLKEGQLFGVPLIELFKRFSSINNIPNIIYHISKNIRENGLNEEGIFRIPGSNTQLQQLKKLYNEGKISSKEDLMTKVEDIHTQASLLKLFIRELPDPLFTFTLYDSFVKSHMAKDKVVRVGSLKVLLGQLPLAHYSLLKFLAELLRDISSLSHINKMTSSNLAIIFGPTVMRPQTEDGVKMIEDARHVNGVFLLIIDEYDYLFNNNEYPSFVGGNKASTTTTTSPTNKKEDSSNNSNNSSISSSPSSLSKRNAGKFNIGSLSDNETISDFEQTMIPTLPSSSSTPTSMSLDTHKVMGNNNNNNNIKSNNKFSILLPSNSNSQVLPVSPTHHRNSPNLSPLPPASPRSSLTLENSPDSNPDIIRTLIKKTCMLLFDKDLPNILTDHYEISKDEIYLPVFDLSVPSSNNSNINNNSDSPRNSLLNNNNNSNSPRSQRLKNSGGSTIKNEQQNSSPTKSTSTKSNDLNPLEIAFSHLVQIRKENKRPSDLNLMTISELNDEKAAIKKELREFDLTFNSQNGYLPRRNEKEIMRPLYQRYREVKNMIEHKSSNNNNNNNNNLNNNLINNNSNNSNNNNSNNYNILQLNQNNNNNIEMGTSSGSSGGSTNNSPMTSNLISTSFGSVTPLSSSGSSLKNSSGSILSSPISETKQQHQQVLHQQPSSSSSSSSSLNNSSSSLYNNSNSMVFNSNIEYSKMNREQLKERYHLIKTEKRTLQIELHRYQSDFMKKHGRKLQFVEDREPVQVQYTKYKDLKSELSTIEKYLAYTSGTVNNNQQQQQQQQPNSDTSIPLQVQK